MRSFAGYHVSTQLYESPTSLVYRAQRDTGVGISSEDQPQLFERFTRFQNPLVMTTSGTGLGLPISAEYARLHGGKIEVESTVGVGSTFTLRLPLVARPPTEVTPAVDLRKPTAQGRVL